MTLLPGRCLCHFSKHHSFSSSRVPRYVRMPAVLALSSTSWTVVEGSGGCSSEEKEVRGNIHAGLTREGSLDKIRLKLGHKKRFINDFIEA